MKDVRPTCIRRPGRVPARGGTSGRNTVLGSGAHTEGGSTSLSCSSSQSLTERDRYGQVVLPSIGEVRRPEGRDHQGGLRSGAVRSLDSAATANLWRSNPWLGTSGRSPSNSRPFGMCRSRPCRAYRWPRCTAPRTGPTGPTATRRPCFLQTFRTPVASTPRCTGPSSGRCGCSPASAPPRTPTSGSRQSSPPEVTGCPPPSTCPP